MKILVAKFQLEANEHVAMKCDLPNVAISYDQDALTHMQLGDVFNSPDIELVPAICADAACSGVMKKTCFDYIEQTILNAVRFCWIMLCQHRLPVMLWAPCMRESL